MPTHEVSATTFAAVLGIDIRPDAIERAGQLGRLCGIAAAQLGSSHPIITLLRQAERDDAALAQALAAIAVLPSLTRRRLIATLAGDGMGEAGRQAATRAARKGAAMTSLDPIAERLAKLERLAARPGSPGEGAAAHAAIERVRRRIQSPPAAAPALVGMYLRLDRSCDRAHGCCQRQGVIQPGRGPHRYELRCADCGRHRGWVKAAAASLLETMQRDDRLRSPILRDGGIVP
jgi:hypothetical protein